MPRGDEVRVGLFVLVALLLGIAGSFWILGTEPWGSTPHRYQLHLPSSGGVRAGDRVRVAGVAVGRVESLDLVAGDSLPVQMEVSISGDVTLSEGAFARLSSDGLLGARYVEIWPGELGAAVLSPGAVITGQETGSIDQVYVVLGDVAEAATSALGKIEALVANLDGSLAPMMENMALFMSEENAAHLTAVLSETEGMLQQLRPRLDSTLAGAETLVQQLTTGTESLPELSESLLGLLADLQKALGEDGAVLAELLHSATATLDTAQATAESYHADNLDVGALMGELESTLQSVRALTESLRENPSSLVGLRGGRGDRRPGEVPKGQ